MTPPDRPPPARARRPRIAVVGGGVSGLTAAWALSSGPGAPDVVVLERADRPGGILRTGTVGDLEVDLGAESVLARRPEAVDLAREAGLGGDLVHPATTAANVYRDGVLRPLPAGTLMGVPGDPDRLRGLLTDAEVARVAQEPALPAGPPADDVGVGRYVADRVGRAVVDHLVEPLLGGVYAGHADALSLRATVPPLWDAAVAGGSLLAAVRARATAPLPGAGHGVVGGGSAPPVFAGLRGGVGRLPVALAAGLAARGVTVRTGATVRGLARTPSGWRLVVGPASAPEAIDVDGVVLAVPAAPAARLLRDTAPEAAARLAAVEAASVAVVALVLPREDVAGLPGSGLLVPPVARRAVKAMTFSSAKWAWVDALDPGAVVVRLSLGRHREEQVLQRDDDDLLTLAVADAADLLGRPLHPRAARVVRWGGALPQYAVGHVERVAAVRAGVAAHPGLAVCGAAFDGVGVPACVAAARRAAAEVLAAVTAPDGVPRTGGAAAAGYWDA